MARVWFAGRMVPIVAPPDSHEPSNEGDEETPRQPELTVPTPSADPKTRRRVVIRGPVDRPLSIKGITGVSTGRLYSDQLIRSVSAVWVTPELKESLAGIADELSRSVAARVASLGSPGLFDTDLFRPLIHLHTQEAQRTLSAATGALKPFAAENMPSGRWLDDLARFQTGFFTSEYIQSLVPNLDIPDFSGLIPVPPVLRDLDIDGLIRSLRARHVPPNWLDVKLDPGDANIDVRGVLADGIPLGWVPSAAVVQRLLDAPDTAARRGVISNNWRGILNDCNAVAESLPAPRALFLADMIRASVRAIRDGHPEAGQALATNVLDTTISQYRVPELSIDKSAILDPNRKEWLVGHGWRVALSLLAVHATMVGKFSLDHRGSSFHRNVTSHAATRRQYNRINAVIAVMIATSTLACYVRETSAFD